MSCFWHTTISPGQQVRTTTERVKVLKVVGEAIGQVVVEGSIPINAVKIDRINAEIRDVTDHVFKNKVVKQGTIHKQIFFVDPEGVVRHIAENIPFMLTVDIPGAERTPFTDVQNHLLDIDTDFGLTPATTTTPGTLMQKVVAHILVKVSEWTQIDVVTKVDIFPKVNSLNRIVCCR
jgi:uncharacterized protein YcfL